MEYLPQIIDSFVANSIADDYPTWVSTTTYAQGDILRYGNYYFKSVSDDNLDNNPEDTLGIYWFRHSISNRFAAIDLQATTSSTTSVGADTVTNGLFTTDTDWTKDTGWTIAGNVAVCDGTADARIYQDAGVVIDNRLEFSIDITSYTSGDMHVAYYTGTEYIKVSTDISATGIVTGEFLVGTEADLEIYLVAGSSGFIGEVNEFTLNNSGDLVVVFAKDVIDTLAIGYYSAETLTIELLDAGGNVVWSVEETQSPNEDVEDYYTYIYSLYTLEVDRTKVFRLPTGLGVNIRVTMTVEGTTSTVSCGYLIGGVATDMGETLYGVGFSFESYSVKTTDQYGVTTIEKRGIQDLVDFETVIDAASMATFKRKVKTIYGEILAFILDPTEDSRYENLVTLGTVDNVSVTLDNPVQSIMSWSIQEII